MVLKIYQKEQLAKEIVLEHAHIVGPVAYIVAESAGITLSKDGKIKLPPDFELTLKELISGYNHFFGRASYEVSVKILNKFGISTKYFPQ